VSDSEPTRGILNHTPMPPPTVLCAISLKTPSLTLPHTKTPLPTLLHTISLRLSSPSENSFILHIHFPGEMTYINALIDSGASVNFIDLAILYPPPHSLIRLIGLQWIFVVFCAFLTEK